jgi:integrase
VPCFTGLRYGDVVSIKENDIKKVDDLTVLDTYTNKTKAKVKVVLTDECIRILEKYSYNLNIPNHQINKELKTLFKKSDHFNEPHPKYKKPDGSPYLKYELITTHTGRRTLLTRLLNEMKVSIPKVMAISGHKQQSTLNKYIQSVDDLVDINQL